MLLSGGHGLSLPPPESGRVGVGVTERLPTPTRLTSFADLLWHRLTPIEGGLS